MAYVCCCLFPLIAIVWLAIAFSGYLKVAFVWSCKFGFYFFGLCFYITIVTYMLNITHKYGVQILTLKQQNKTVYKGEEVQSILSKIMIIVLINLAFTSILAYLASYFMIWYIKYTFVGYVCFIFGYVASYPLADEDVKLLIINPNCDVSNTLKTKAFLNSTVFFSIGNAPTDISKANIAKVDGLSSNLDSTSLLRTIIDDDLKNEDIFSNMSHFANSKIPDQSKEDSGKPTLFIPMDEVLFYSYIPDENMGLYDMPKFKEYDMRIELNDYRTFAFIYFREDLEEFLNYIDKHFEPILYTTGEKTYIDKIMDTIDENKIFRHRLYQDDCHLFKNSKQSVIEYLKDINLFTNRSIKRKVLIDISPLNYVLSPDNIIPIEAYHPDSFANPDEKDDSLKMTMEVLESILNQEDIREILVDKFNLRQMAINSKLL